MTEVCKDLDGQSAWHYDAETQTYARRKPEGDIDQAKGGKLLAHLHGRDIPNPAQLWLRRCDRAGVKTESTIGARLKPSPATFALYAHWEGVRDAEHNA